MAQIQLVAVVYQLLSYKIYLFLKEYFNLEHYRNELIVGHLLFLLNIIFMRFIYSCV